MKRLLIVLLALAMTSCNDLTAPLPAIEGTFDYASFSSDVSLNRRGSLNIVDTNRRTARFEGTFQYVTGSAAPKTGRLIGAFMAPNRIWFRFLDERAVFHEADLGGLFGTGVIFFLGTSYEPSGASFTLRRR